MQIDEELMRESVVCEEKRTDLLRSLTSLGGFRTPNEHSAL
jgi:hypothetical protein